jgi:chromosome partitioning protein
MSVRRSFIVALANHKGGVAKTTSTVSLGGALTLHGKEVLVIDLDAQANLTMSLGIDPSRVRGTINDALYNSATLRGVSHQTAVPGLDIVPANAAMVMAERFLPRRLNYEMILRQAIERQFELARVSDVTPGSQEATVEIPVNHDYFTGYDFLLLDCPPSSGAVTLNALVAADLLIVPTQPEYFSAYSLRSMMEMIRQVRTLHNPGLAYRILITMLDRRNRIHLRVNEQIQESFGEGVFKTRVFVDTKLREAVKRGLPITHSNGLSRSALQYMSLAQEIINYAERKF